MVKNTTGGGNAKKQARKLTTNRSSNELRKSENASELYACITKNYGNRMDVITQKDGTTLSCRLAGKFKGRNKPKNCELLYIYEKNEIDELRNLPGIDWKYLNIASNNNFDDDNNDEAGNATIIFTESATNKTVDELYDTNSENVASTLHDEEEINIEDL